MSGFSASEAALEGFRITRENPRAFGAWVGATFFVAVLGPILSVMMPANVRHGLDTMSATETPTVGQFMDALIVISPILFLGLAIQCIMAAAVYRLIFRHDDTRFGYLRLGADELRLMSLTVIYVIFFILLVVGVTMVSAIALALASIAGRPVAEFVGLVAWLASMGAVIFVLVRLSLAPVATFAERRLALFESWTLTRGQFWKLLGTYALAVCCIAVVGLLVMVLFTALAGIIVIMTGGSFSDVSSIINPNGSSLRAYLSVGVIAYMIVSSIFSALYNAVIAAPGAIAYQKLHGDPPRHPLAVQAEAG